MKNHLLALSLIFLLPTVSPADSSLVNAVKGAIINTADYALLSELTASCEEPKTNSTLSQEELLARHMLQALFEDGDIVEYYPSDEDMGVHENLKYWNAVRKARSSAGFSCPEAFRNVKAVMKTSVSADSYEWLESVERGYLKSLAQGD